MTNDAKVAYYCMEFGIDGLIYNGGLGVLAGDFIKSCADLKLPIVGVGLNYSNGNWHQSLSPDNNFWQEKWNDFMRISVDMHPESVSLGVQGRNVNLTAGQYKVFSSIPGESNFVPLELIGTKGNNGNRHWDDNIANELYPGEDYNKLVQQHVLGTGGVRMLEALGYNDILVDHMNEGHAALLGLERARKSGNLEEAMKHIVFTTHTAVPAGRPSFDWRFAEDILRDSLPDPSYLQELTGDSNLDLMKLALALADKSFGVSWLHTEVSKYQFMGYPKIAKLSSKDNGVHPYWASTEIAELYDQQIGIEWRKEPRLLEQVIDKVSDEQVLQAHEPARERLANFLSNEKSTNRNGSQRAKNFGASYDSNKLTIGFARRFATYKQATLIFKELDRLRDLGDDLQIVFAGKSHPADDGGKGVIREVFEYMRELQDDVNIWFVEDYDLRSGRYMVQGVDLWMNTPKIFEEASGTSGMKAALNGVPQFSVADGWWYPQDASRNYHREHGLIEGVTGWSIGNVPGLEDLKYFLDDSTRDFAREKEWDLHGESLIYKLENEIIPLWKSGGNNLVDKKDWAKVMKGNIAHNGAWYTSHRMAEEYMDLYRSMGHDV